MSLEALLALLDCPECARNSGLVPQKFERNHYLACSLCEFWYPIQDEVCVLLPPARNERGMRRPLQAAVELPLARRPLRELDAKAVLYSFHVRMSELCSAWNIHAEPLVVDVGCSTGSFAAALAPEQTYVGFDLSFPSLAFARRATGHFFVQADAERLPIKTGSVPFFVSREVLEHLNDPVAGARELRRVARRGVVVVPTLDFPFLYDPINYVLVRRGKRIKFGIYGYDHHEIYDIAGWREILLRAGLEVERERPVGTGLALNAGDVFWHALFSWREFDSLPRNGVPERITRPLFALYDALHRVDGPLYAKRSLSQAFEVRPTPT